MWLVRGLVVVLLFALPSFTQDQPSQTRYSEHGSVVYARIASETVGSVVMGVGSVGQQKKWVYRVDCGDHFVELQGGGKQSLQMDQKVEFRIEKGKAYLPGDKKESSYRVVGMGKTDPKPAGQTD
jgi:cold shock CspA family protein